MIKYLALVLDLLELEPKDSYLEVGEYIVAHPWIRLSLCHPAGFLFSAFADFVAGRIDQEQFVALWDMYSQKTLQKYSISCTPSLFLESISYGLTVTPDQYSNTLFVLHKPAVCCDISSLTKQLQPLWSQIFLF